MAKLDEFKHIVEKYASVSDFVIVYINEAHPKNDWAFKTNPYQIEDHKTIDDRIFAANVLAQNELGCPILVDTMLNESNMYAALPERLYVLLDGKVAYKGNRGPMWYNPEEVKQWLQNYQNKVK